MDKLFQLFGKVKRTEKENTYGIGMGLNICQKIIEHNGGVLDVFSEGENLGSTFMFTMPMALPDDDCQILEERNEDNTEHWHSMSIGEILDQSAKASNAPVSKPELPQLNLDIFLEESKIDDSQLPLDQSLVPDCAEKEIQSAKSEKAHKQDDDSDLSIDFQDFFVKKKDQKKSK